MVRDLEKESQKIRNGNRFISDEGGSGVFPRDTDRLLREYTNLRKKIYNTYKNVFNDEATRKELSSYIDEQFVKLVKEYDINSPVDFPGYIKIKLPLRVKQTFVKNQFRDKGREWLTTEEDEIEQMLETTENYMNELSIEDRDLREFVFKGTHFNPIESEIITLWLNRRLTDREIVSLLMKSHKKSKREVERAITEMKEYVLIKLKEYNKE